MSNSNAKAIKGLSIAVLVFSALTIVAALIGIVALAIGGAALPSIIDHGYYLYYNDPSFYEGLEELREYGITTTDAYNLAMFAIGITIALVVWLLLCSAVTLVASILGIRNAAKPEKLASAFGWSIAGAIAAFLSGRMITTVLLVIMAVLIGKARSAQTAGAGYANAGAQTPYGYAASGYNGYGYPGYAAGPAPAYGQQQAMAYQPQQPAYGYDAGAAQAQAQAQAAGGYTAASSQTPGQVTVQPSAAPAAASSPSPLAADGSSGSPADSPSDAADAETSLQAKG